MRQIDKPGSPAHIVTTMPGSRAVPFISPTASAITASGSAWHYPFSVLLKLSYTPVKRPLPFVNFKDGGGICDLDHAPHFRRCVHVASRLTQPAGIILVGYDEKTAGGIAPQFDRQALQHFLKRRRLRRFIWSLQSGPRNAQIVRQALSLRIEVRDKREKREKALLTVTFSRFPRFSRRFVGSKPSLDGSAAGVFFFTLHQAMTAQNFERCTDLLR